MLLPNTVWAMHPRRLHIPLFVNVSFETKALIMFPILRQIKPELLVQFRMFSQRAYPLHPVHKRIDRLLEAFEDPAVTAAVSPLTFFNLPLT